MGQATQPHHAPYLGYVSPPRRAPYLGHISPSRCVPRTGRGPQPGQVLHPRHASQPHHVDRGDRGATAAHGRSAVGSCWARGDARAFRLAVAASALGGAAVRQACAGLAARASWGGSGRVCGAGGAGSGRRHRGFRWSGGRQAGRVDRSRRWSADDLRAGRARGAGGAAGGAGRPDRRTARRAPRLRCSRVFALGSAPGARLAAGARVSRSAGFAPDRPAAVETRG